MLNIAIIDSNEADLQALRDQLDSLDFVKVQMSFSDPREALSAFDLRSPDMIITAVELPWLNGLSLVRRMQEHHPGISVVLVSASSRFACEAYEVGARGYLLKPIEPDKLRTLLRRRTFK